jgi:hypothetical protein
VRLGGGYCSHGGDEGVVGHVKVRGSYEGWLDGACEFRSVEVMTGLAGGGGVLDLVRDFW